MSLARAAAACVVAAAVAGCSTPPARPADVPLIAGRLAVRIDEQPVRSVSADFELSGTADHGQLTLSGPLGTTAAQARWAPGLATLTSGGRSTDYPDLDRLAVDALGEHVPIAALFDWLQGRAWTGAAARPRADGAPGFEQLGWQISLARWSEGWVEARRDAPPVVTVRARIDPAP